MSRTYPFSPVFTSYLNQLTQEKTCMAYRSPYHLCYNTLYENGPLAMYNLVSSKQANTASTEREGRALPACQVGRFIGTMRIGGMSTNVAGSCQMEHITETLASSSAAAQKLVFETLLSYFQPLIHSSCWRTAQLPANKSSGLWVPLSGSHLTPTMEASRVESIRLEPL